MEPSKDLLNGNPFDNARRRPVEAELVVVSPTSYESRQLDPIEPISRSVCQYEIHELMITDESNPAESEYIDRVGVLGFVEITKGGVIAVGDEVAINGESIGNVIGFDATHAPNHYNIIVHGDSAASGLSQELKLDWSIQFL